MSVDLQIGEYGKCFHELLIVTKMHGVRNNILQNNELELVTEWKLHYALLSLTTKNNCWK